MCCVLPKYKLINSLIHKTSFVTRVKAQLVTATSACYSSSCRGKSKRNFCRTRIVRQNRRCLGQLRARTPRWQAAHKREVTKLPMPRTSRDDNDREVYQPDAEIPERALSFFPWTSQHRQGSMKSRRTWSRTAISAAVLSVRTRDQIERINSKTGDLDQRRVCWFANAEKLRLYASASVTWTPSTNQAGVRIISSTART